MLKSCNVPYNVCSFFAGTSGKPLQLFMEDPDPTLENKTINGDEKLGACVKHNRLTGPNLKDLIEIQFAG